MKKIIVSANKIYYSEEYDQCYDTLGQKIDLKKLLDYERQDGHNLIKIERAKNSDAYIYFYK